MKTFLVPVGLLLILFKLAGVIAWSWWLVLAPFIVAYVGTMFWIIFVTFCFGVVAIQLSAELIVNIFRTRA
jgi:hypothetical protein